MQDCSRKIDIKLGGLKLFTSRDDRAAYVTACKAVYPGSNPGPGFKALKYFLQAQLPDSNSLCNKAQEELLLSQDL